MDRTSFKTIFASLPLIGFSVLCFSFAQIANAQEIKIGGTGNALGSMHLLADAYMKTNPAVKITVLPSMGSSGAIKAVPKGAIDIGLSSRTLKEEESKAGLSMLEYAISPTVIAVQDKSKVKGITTAQLVDIYTGSLTQWPDGSQIRPIMRQPGDDNTSQIRGLSPTLPAAIELADKRPGLAFAFTDQEAVEKIEATPGSFGVTTLTLILSEKRPLRALSLDGVEPTLANIKNKRYPLIKNFYFILPAAPSAAAQAFIKFVQSPEGTKILNHSGSTTP